MLRTTQLHNRPSVRTSVYHRAPFYTRAVMPTTAVMSVASIAIQEPMSSTETTGISAAVLVGTKRPPVPHAEKAWEFFRAMGSPKYHVAPMVDQVCAICYN